MRSPWVKNDDGSWGKLSDPDDRGGDNNVYYEDKMAMIWTIDNSIARFESMGCFTACHDGEDEEVKPYGNKYTRSEGELGDIWHWKSVRNLGQVDDQISTIPAIRRTHPAPDVTVTRMTTAGMSTTRLRTVACLCGWARTARRATAAPAIFWTRRRWNSTMHYSRPVT